MVYSGGRRVRIIAANSPEEFEKELNKALAALDANRSKYELQFNHSMGYCAYIVSEVTTMIPETIEDEFKIAGEDHVCSECPFWTEPAKKSARYSRCEMGEGLRKAETPCCAKFYEMLLDGEIGLKEEAKGI